MAKTRKAGILSNARAPPEDRLPAAKRRSVPRNDLAHACATPSSLYSPLASLETRPLVVSPAPFSVWCGPSVCRITGTRTTVRPASLSRPKDIPRAPGRIFETVETYAGKLKIPPKNGPLQRRLASRSSGKRLFSARRLDDRVSPLLVFYLTLFTSRGKTSRPRQQTNRRQGPVQLRSLSSEVQNRRTQMRGAPRALVPPGRK